MRLGIAADHEGYLLKQQILEELHDTTIILDYGDLTLNPGDDYPDFVVPLAKAVANGEIDRGIAICGSGIGVSIAANKINSIRAALVHDELSVRLGVEDDNINILCIGAQLTDLPLALKLIHCFTTSHFSEEPRHKRRLAKIEKLEEMENPL